jgi:hypothetical protein
MGTHGFRARKTWRLSRSFKEKEMIQLRVLIPSAGVIAIILALTGARADSRTSNHDYAPGGWNIPTAEIVNRVGEVLAAIDSPQRRSQLAEQWLTFARQVIAKDQDFRKAWLHFQEQQSEQQQEAEQLRLEIAKLQMRVEQLRAENLRLEQQNLQMQMKLAQGTSRQALREAPPQSRPRQDPGNARTHNPPPGIN